MANNRMLLICNVCHPERPAEFTYNGEGYKGVLAIAKWYPSGAPLGEIVKGSGAYYRNDNGENLGEEFLEFLQEHSHEEYASKDYLRGAGQENPIRLEYESEGLPILEGGDTT